MEDFYRKNFFEVLDILTGEIKRRFRSKTFDLYSTIEDTLHKAASGVDVPGASINVLIEHFHDDIQKDDLCTELSMLKT